MYNEINNYICNIPDILRSKVGNITTLNYEVCNKHFNLATPPNFIFLCEVSEEDIAHLIQTIKL